MLDAFPPDVRVEFPNGQATVVGRVVRCDLGPSSMTTQRVWCELCPWEAGIAPFKFALEAALAHDASCSGTPEHLELIGPRTWRRIPDAELDRRAASKRTRRVPPRASEGAAAGLAERTE
ncbi:hypothetical protein [Amycolatopsis magusensis]|uniref:hypothetical protein n=1 Tax=Amycolatopsis magusensis TaxID=882444 RepID=UPI0037BDA804